jgi:hypothetical protein
MKGIEQGTVIANEKVFLPRTSRPISIKLATNYSWLKEGSGSLQRGDNQKNVKIR